MGRHPRYHARVVVVSAVTALCAGIHAQWLAMHEARQRMVEGPTPVRHTVFQREVDRLRAMLAELRTMPAKSTGEAAAKVRVVLGLFDQHGDLDGDAHAILGEPVPAWLDRVCDDLDAM
jgi:hypothetical protein